MTRSGIDPAYADLLLEGRAPYGSDQDLLIILLAQASCAPVPAELGDEARALTAFRTARADLACSRTGSRSAAPANHGPGRARRRADRTGRTGPGSHTAQSGPSGRRGRIGRPVPAGPVLASLVAVAASVAIGVFGYTAAGGFAPWPGGTPVQTGLPGVAGSPAPRLSAAVVADSAGSATGGTGSRTGTRGGRAGQARSDRPTLPARPSVPASQSQLVVAGATPRPAGGSGAGFAGPADPVPPGSLAGGVGVANGSGAPSFAPVPPPVPPLVTVPAGGAPVLAPAPDLGGQATVAAAGPPSPAPGPATSVAPGSGRSPAPAAGSATGAAGAATGASRVSPATARQLCAAWAKGQDRVSRAGAPDLTALIALAGGERQVPAFCESLTPPPPRG